MMKSKKWSEEAIMRNRRKRMARRLYKKIPLFAPELISKRFNIKYDYEDLFKDLPLKKGYERRKKRGKIRVHGKWGYLLQIKNDVKKALFEDNQAEINRIMKKFYLFQENRNEPWRISVKYSEQDKVEYTFVATTSFNVVMTFWQKAQKLYNQPNGKELVENVFNDIKSYSNVG